MNLPRFVIDLLRIAAMTGTGAGMLAVDEPLALWLGRPEVAPWLMFVGMALFGIALSHVARRLLFPYLDLRHVAADAKQSTGSGLVFLGVCLVLAALLLILPTAVKAEQLVPPARALQHLPTLQAEQRAHWPDMPMPAVLGAQVEQETCISLSHRMCWSPRAELRTARERGVGLGQITKTARFDALAELRALHREQLAGWSWDDDSIYDARLQLRGLVLKDLQLYRAILGTAGDGERIRMMLAAYNGGLGGLISDRKLCGGTPGCDKARWVDHVERTSLKAKTAHQGYGKSFFEINREYPRNIMGPRLPRYTDWL